MYLCDLTIRQQDDEKVFKFELSAWERQENVVLEVSFESR